MRMIRAKSLLVFLLALFLAVPSACGKNEQAGSAAPEGEGVLLASADKILWLSLDEGKKKAEAEGKTLYIDFYADWCRYCKKMDKDTYSDKEVIRALNAYFVPVKINGDKHGDLAREYYVRGYPTSVFAKADGKPIRVLPGYVPADTFMAVLKFFHSGAYQDMSLDDFMKKGMDKTYEF